MGVSLIQHFNKKYTNLHDVLETVFQNLQHNSMLGVSIQMEILQMRMNPNRQDEDSLDDNNGFNINTGANRLNYVSVNNGDCCICREEFTSLRECFHCKNVVCQECAEKTLYHKCPMCREFYRL